MERNSGSVSANFTVTLSSSSSSTVTFGYATQNGTATAPADYTAKQGTLQMNPGTTTRTVTITVKGDRVVEPNETFFVNITAATNASIADGQGTGTITNDD